MTYEAFQSQFQIHLDPQQEAAVQQTEGPALLLAVPGSGKTTVLVTRLGYLVYGRGIDPANILTVTYTVAATRDMKARFQTLFGPQDADRLAFRTINGICATIIRVYAREKGRTPFRLVSSEGELSAILRGLLAESGTEYPSDQLIKEIRTQITYVKNSMLTEQEIQALEVDGVDFPAVYEAYQRYLREHRCMDFDDQMGIAYQILRRYPDLLARFQARYRYLCVDEAQDTSKIQHTILRLLAARYRNLFLVGDEDQSIYGFRAAWPQALLEFEQVYPGARVLLMETNYRSGRAIVERADAFIQRNQNRHPKHMRAARREPGELRAVELADYSRQYDWLARTAEGCRERTAVLYRNNDSARPLIDLLERRGIPYACRQRESAFFTSPAVRDVTEILAFAWDDCNAERFLNFYYKLDLKLKRALVAGALRQKPAEVPVLEALLASGAFEGWQIGKLKALQTHFSKLPGLTSYAALQRIIKYMGYGAYVQEKSGDTARLGVLLALAGQTQDLLHFLERLEELRTLVETREPDLDCPFQLSTIHASKGLEYERVILMDVMDGLFPSVDLTEGETGLSEEERDALEEERRLFYVGVTRAKQRLEILTYRRRFGEEAPRASFAEELLGLPEPIQRPPERAAAELENVPEASYPPGTELIHRFFGRGVLLSRQSSIATIRFPSGVKKIDLTACLRKGLVCGPHPEY